MRQQAFSIKSRIHSFSNAFRGLGLFFEYNDKIKKIKDLAAGAVLICAIAAVIIGCIIFIPHLITLVNLSLS